MTMAAGTELYTTDIALVTARAIFESWFADFNPFCTEAEGRNPDPSKPFAALRNALFPKLISRKLRVPDVERIVGRGR